MKIKYLKQTLAIGLFLFVGVVSRGAHASAATLTVTNTNDTGAGSFRQAISDSNANAGADTISFSISGTGPHTIDLATPIAIMDGDLVVDGLSQTGSVCDADTITPMVSLNYQFTDIVLDVHDTTNNNPVEINGLAFANGSLRLGSENTVVRCNTFGTDDTVVMTGEAVLRVDSNYADIHQNVFAVTRTDTAPLFMLDGVYGGGGPKTDIEITRNFFGTDPTGARNLIASPNGAVYGPTFYSDAERVVIGGTDPADGNVFRNLAVATYIDGTDSGSVSVVGNSFVDNGAPILSEFKEPIIRSIQTVSGQTQVDVELDASLAPGTYRLELFTNPTRRNGTFIPFQGEPVGTPTMHGINATSLAGVATVTKTETGAQEVTATIAGSGYTNLTITATVDNGGTLGHTTALGYDLAADSVLGIDVNTNVGANRCYPAGSSGTWSITVTNNGTQSEHEFGILFATVSSPESLFDLNAFSATGTASDQSYFGVYPDSGSGSQTAMLFWEGDLQPGQHVTIAAPVDYGQTQIITQALNVVSQMPASAFSSSDVGAVIQEHADQHHIGVAVNCDFAADLTASIELVKPGITPGGSGTYVTSVTNNGPQAIATPSPPTDFNSIGTASYTLVLGVPRHSTVQSVEVDGQKPCLYLTPESVGSDPQTIDLSTCGVVCVDYGLMSGGQLSTQIAASPYSALVACFSWHGLAVGASSRVTVTVQTDSTIDNTAQFAAHVIRTGSAFSTSPLAAPFDVDTSYMMSELGFQSNITNDPTMVYNPINWLSTPINNTATYIGLNSSASGGGTGTLTAAGQPVMVAIEAIAAVSIGVASVLLRRHFAYRLTH